MSLPLLTDCGLPGIRTIPYGVHMCNFYRTREELAEALVPFFLAGLGANERCIWITAEPLKATLARASLEQAGFDVGAHLRDGSLILRDYDDWYAEAGSLKGNEVVELWLEQEQRALAQGYAGLRITGNVTFLRPDEWDLFMEYEQLVNQSFHGRRIVTLCTYHLDSCGPAEVFDVMRRHSCTLDHPDEGWQILTADPS
jgi:hypothetical protein